MNELKNYIRQLSHLTDEEWVAFSSILKKEKLAKRELFLERGKICKTSAFIASGLFKLYTVDTRGNEKIIQFNGESSFLSDCESYIQQKPSGYFIEAMEDCEIIVFSNSGVELLCKEFSVFDKIGRHVTHEIMAYHKEHLRILMTLSPLERYEFMLSTNPRLVQRISVTELSHYLGLTRETVSRLRSKITG